MLDYAQLAALHAINREGSFEGAGRSLRISSFAVSQRVKQLEKSLGVTLVERGPTRTSDFGKILCRHTSEVATLEDAVIDNHRIACNSLGNVEAAVYRIALPEECISGWFGRVFRKRTEAGDPSRFDMTIADSGQTLELMQAGTVVAAISSLKEPIHGFKAYRLGEMRFVAVASPSFVERYFGDGVTLDTLRQAPCLRLCQHDGLATEWTESQFGKRPALSLYNFPGSRDSLGSVLSDHAWTMMPATDAEPCLADSSLVELRSETPLIRPLYWHVSGAMVPAMTEITKTVRRVAFESGELTFSDT